MNNLINSFYPAGTIIVTSNKWSGFSNEDISGCFQHLNKEEIKNLKPGDDVWRDEEPYHHHGKVYGYTLRKVEKIENNRIYFDEGNFDSVDHNSLYKIPEDKIQELINLINEHKPKCFNTGY